MMGISMSFYATETPDGNVHVQNAVMGMLGQHHVHTQGSYARWKREPKVTVKASKGTCDCGLKPGDVREYDGKVWHSDKFGKA